MKSMAKQKLTGKFDWQTSEIVPAFLQGEDAEALWETSKDIATGTMGYDSEQKLIYGSTLFLAARVDTQLRALGLRAANLRDLSRPEVMRMAKDKHYIDSPTVVIRSEEDLEYPSNNSLINKLMDEASRLHEKLPFMVIGFDSAPCKDGGYNRTIVPRDDFKIIYDERLNGKYGGKRFTEVDDLGIPLFDEKGERVWYARGIGAAGVFLYRGLNLDSRYWDVDYSDDDGRVVGVSAEGASQNFSLDYLAKLQEERDAQIRKVQERYAKAEAILRGK